MALGSGAVALIYAWVFFGATDSRPDGNWGHCTIDFGGQWIMGRMVVEGHANELYYRPTLLAVLNAHYPVEDNGPNADATDGEDLVNSMMRGDGKTLPDTVNGPLYPPLHGFFMAPLALLPPRPAYHLLQTINLLLVFALGWLAQRLSNGRVWWPLASAVLFVFPGYAGAINLAQNAVFTLFFLTTGWWLMTRGRPVLGGVVWGLLAAKPVWAVVFLPVLLFSGRWRMALAMAVTGASLALATLPFTGIHTWFDWLAVGRLAAINYARDKRWVQISRDLEGVVRRPFTEDLESPLPSFLAGGGVPSVLLVLAAAAVLFVLLRRPNVVVRRGIAWTFVVAGLWAAIVQIVCHSSSLPSYLADGAIAATALTTMLIALLYQRTVRVNHGPAAAFLLLGAWVSCFHFMYYDTLLAALPLLLLFTRPGGSWLAPWRSLGRTQGRFFAAIWSSRPWLGSWRTLVKTVRSFFVELELEGPGVVPWITLVLLIPPAYVAWWYYQDYVYPPYDTYVLLGLWVWCGWWTVRAENKYLRALRQNGERDDKPSLAADIWPAPISSRSFRPMSSARISDSPTRMARTPADCRRSTSALVRMPLSLTRQTPAGTSAAISSVCSSRVTNVRRSRLLIPTRRAPASNTRFKFDFSYSSTSACMPSSSVCRSSRGKASSSRISAMSSTASAPARRASMS